MLPRSSALIHAGRRGPWHEHSAATRVVTQFGGWFAAAGVAQIETTRSVPRDLQEWGGFKFELPSASLV
jgi:hypothetical protein